MHDKKNILEETDLNEARTQQYKPADIISKTEENKLQNINMYHKM